MTSAMYRRNPTESSEEGGAFMARGFHGQRIYVDPKAERGHRPLRIPPGGQQLGQRSRYLAGV